MHTAQRNDIVTIWFILYSMYVILLIFTFSDASTSGRKFDSSDDNSKASRIGVRRVASSRLAREAREDKYKGDQQEVSK